MDALIPPPRDDDDEDVYLALQTAKALWSRNEREDALRWLRRAAEQASDANADDRALELFKAAADMASRLQAGAAPAAPSVPPGRPAGGGPPPPPNRPPVELAPGPRGAAASIAPPGAPPARPPSPAPDARPPLPRSAQASTAPPPPPHLSSVPPAPGSPPPAGYGPGPGRATSVGGFGPGPGQGGYSPGPAPVGQGAGAGQGGYGAGQGGYGAGQGAGYDARGTSPAPPPARPAPVPSRPPAASAHSAPQAVPLLRPKNPGSVTPPPPQQRPQQAFTPAPPPGRPTPGPQVPQVPQVPQATPDAGRPDEGAYRRAGTMIGPGAFAAPAAPAGARASRATAVFDAAPVLDADEDDESIDAPTKVGKLPPQFREQPAAPPGPIVPPLQRPQGPPGQGGPGPAPVIGQPRKAARRRTLSRGEQSPLAPGRKPAAGDPRAAGSPSDPRAAGDGRGAGDSRGAGDGRGAGDSRGGHGVAAGSAAGVDARRARDGAGRGMPSEVPTAPGNDARAGAARAAALRALAVADDEVTAQRDIGMLHGLREHRFDDLDEDTSVLPGLKLDANGRAIGFAPGATTRDPREPRESREPRDNRDGGTSRDGGTNRDARDGQPRDGRDGQPRDARGAREALPRDGREPREGRRGMVDDDTTRRVSERELTRGLVASRQAADPYAAAALEDDRPTPTDAEQDLSATVPPDTSRTSSASVEAAVEAASMDTGRYSAIDAMWITSAAASAEGHGRSPTIQNPSMAAQAAAADAAVAAAAAAQRERERERETRPGPVGQAVPPAAVIPPPAAASPSASSAAPWSAFRVVVLGPDAAGAVRVAPLAPGARPPAGATLAMLVPTTEAESQALARLFGAKS